MKSSRNLSSIDFNSTVLIERLSESKWVSPLKFRGVSRKLVTPKPWWWWWDPSKPLFFTSRSVFSRSSTFNDSLLDIYHMPVWFKMALSLSPISGLRRLDAVRRLDARRKKSRPNRPRCVQPCRCVKLASNENGVKIQMGRRKSLIGLKDPIFLDARVRQLDAAYVVPKC